MLGCPRELGSMVRINGLEPSYKWGILGVWPIDPNYLLTSWDIQVGISSSISKMQILLEGRTTYTLED